MSRKLQVTLPDPTAEKLWQLAENADQPPGRLASQLLQRTIDYQARRPGQPSPPKLPTFDNDSGPREPGQRPPWLPPYENTDTWRALTWGAVAALHARYPNQLQNLKQDWWQDTAQLEKLSAIAHWRQQLDDGAADPREELYFHDTLDRLATQLARQPGSGARWDPNTIPGWWNR
jgi:hypothetical protein